MQVVVAQVKNLSGLESKGLVQKSTLDFKTRTHATVKCCIHLFFSPISSNCLQIMFRSLNYMHQGKKYISIKHAKMTRYHLQTKKGPDQHP